MGEAWTQRPSKAAPGPEAPSLPLDGAEPPGKKPRGEPDEPTRAASGNPPKPTAKAQGGALVRGPLATFLGMSVILTPGGHSLHTGLTLDISREQLIGAKRRCSPCWLAEGSTGSMPSWPEPEMTRPAFPGTPVEPRVSRTPGPIPVQGSPEAFPQISRRP